VPVVASVGRLGTVSPSAPAAVALIKQTGIIPEWDLPAAVLMEGLSRG
jgi:hypothetical protein